jgi:hypothetical protein
VHQLYAGSVAPIPENAGFSNATFAGPITGAAGATVAGTITAGGQFTSKAASLTNLFSLSATNLNTFYYPSNVIANATLLAQIKAGMTNGGFCIAMISNNLVAFGMSNNITTAKNLLYP